MHVILSHTDDRIIKPMAELILLTLSVIEVENMQLVNK